MGQMLLEGDILALPSVKFYGAVETLCIVVAIGCGFEEEAGAGELYRLDSGIMVRKESGHTSSPEGDSCGHDTVEACFFF